jgi:hypothetical protein
VQVICERSGIPLVETMEELTESQEEPSLYRIASSLLISSLLRKTKSMLDELPSFRQNAKIPDTPGRKIDKIHVLSNTTRRLYKSLQSSHYS